MQIFELTQQRRRPISEINLGAIGKAVGSAATAAAGQYLAQKTGVQSLATGGDTANPYAGANAKDKAMAAVATMSKPQAAQQKALYDKALSQLMAEKGVTDAASLTQSDTKALSQNLYQQILKNLLQNNLTDYAKLPQEIAAGQPQQQATDVVKRMNDAMTQIQNVPIYGKQKPADQLKTWEALTQAAGEALVLLKFNPATGAAAAPGASNINPAVQKMAQTAAAGKLTAQQLGLNQVQISNFQSKFPPGTNPKLDMLFKALGLYP
jgi:hypothetical protein